MTLAAPGQTQKNREAMRMGQRFESESELLHIHTLIVIDMRMEVKPHRLLNGFESMPGEECAIMLSRYIWMTEFPLEFIPRKACYTAGATKEQ